MLQVHRIIARCQRDGRAKAAARYKKRPDSNNERSRSGSGWGPNARSLDVNVQSAALGNRVGIRRGASARLADATRKRSRGTTL